MNIYDFDGTLYTGDSTRDFLFFLLLRHPRALRCVPAALGTFFRVRKGEKTLTDFKESLFRIFSDVPDVPREAETFWERKAKKLKKWYREKAREDDLVISASPEFLVKKGCEKLGIRRVIASRVDPATGKFEGINCRDEEKIRRLRAEYPDARAEEFYSDSHADDPLARLSERAFWVKGEKVSPWRFPG